ncbi:MAG: ATP-binding cassette domain-containing protein, partial [Lentisphaeria bacterium]
MTNDFLLKFENVDVIYSNKQYEKCAVKNFNLTLKAGQCAAIVGESGSGKSTIAKAILGLLPDSTKVTGNILFNNKNLCSLNERKMRKIRGNQIAMIFQNPMSCLNPHLSIGTQIVEQLKQHNKISTTNAKIKAIELLNEVGINNPQSVIKNYPVQLSGGMQQRVMIAMALSCNPDLLIADEPTTALDVTIQAQILNDIKSMLKSRNLALLMISHDLAIVSQICQKITIMRHGQIVESQDNNSKIFKSPSHSYTKSLIDAINPLRQQKNIPLIENELIKVNNLKVTYPSQKLPKVAVNQISFSVLKGEIFGIAGESGSGKSTLLKVLANFIKPNEGEIFFDNNCLHLINNKTLYKDVQLIFQDPYASLNPHMTIFESIAEPLAIFNKLYGSQLKNKISHLMSKCGLNHNLAHRYPHELSGGECQRAGIARAISISPKLLLCDEPISALDVLIQRQIKELILQLQKDLNLTI